MHSLLRRQLRRHGLEALDIPAPIRDLLRSVSNAYDASDADRLTLERSLDLSSQELLTTNIEMLEASELLRATLESTEDGILAVDIAGRVKYTNPRFAQIWRIPDTLLVGADEGAMLAYVVSQVAEPEAFLATILELHGSAAEILDSVLFKDGRVVERYSRPLHKVGAVTGRVWSFRDITQRRHAEDALRASEQRFRALAQNSSDIIVVVDATGSPTYVSPSAERIMGYAAGELQDVSLVSLLHPEDLAAGAESFAAVLTQPGMHPSKEVRLKRKDGTWRDIDLVANNLLDDPAVQGVVINAHDVTERIAAERTLRESEERLRRMAETTPVGIYEMNVGRRVTYLNPAACAIFEVEGENEMNSLTYSDFFSPESLKRIQTEHAKRDEGTSSTYEVEMIGARGTRRDVLITGTPLVVESAAVGVIGTIIDITERRQQERILEFAATHDPLTEALNRSGFEHEVERLVAGQGENHSSGAVLFLDLDDFKAVNDTFGHPVGDKLLASVTRVFQSELRQGDVLARLGGDEFAVLLPSTTPRHAKTIARRLLRALARNPVDIEGRLVETLCSIGIAMIPAHGSTSDELLARADIAMYEAKEHGRNRVRLYTGRSRWGKAAERLKWKHRIREALDNDGLMLYGQPIVDLVSGNVQRYELLLRMSGGKDGRLLLPGAFLGIAETYGLIAEIDAWVVQEAFRFLQKHEDDGTPLRVAVNLSARALDDEALLRVIKRQLAQTGVDPASICFEVTESAAILDLDKAKRFISGITELGCEFSLDDFGVGFSSFSRLKHLPIHELKIDGSFIQNLMHSPVDQHLVRAIVELARGLGMRVVAEFVQDEASVELLRSYGVDLGQGYHLGRPVPVQNIRAPSVPDRLSSDIAA